MASSAPLSAGEKYHVFLSFRGPDTRQGFADCIFEFLKGAGLRVFMDDEEIRVGESIGGEIQKAIYDSKIFLPIFSRGFASSKWCLKEISWMADCMEEFPGEKKMLPVFYDVDANDVKLKTDLYRDALNEHEKTSGYETVERWRKVLTKIPETKGWNPTDAKGQGKLIKRIAEHICCTLEIKHRNLPEHFIGIEEKIQDIMNMLDCGSRDVRIVVIHGMGGIGKTTLAGAIFNKICWQFQGSSFLANVRESSPNNGIVKLQNKLLHDVLRFSSHDYVDENDAMNCIQGSLRNKNVLIVLDDVSDRDQIKKVVGMGKWLGLGSRMIITTRNLNCVANIEEIENIAAISSRERIYVYRMRELGYDDSIELLSWHAFNQHVPLHGYEQLSHEMLSLTKGIPLAIEILGSLLRGTSTGYWIAMLEKLKKVPDEGLYGEILMSSYNALSDEEKEIFLDIAFFFANQDKTNSFFFWDACQLFPEISLGTLISYALVKIDCYNRIWMHDLLKDLGRQVDHKQSKGDLGKRSRLCNEDAKRLLRKTKKMKHVKALKLDSSHSHDFTPAAFSGLSNLRFLELTGGNFIGDFKDVCLSELRWLFWQNCASNFRATNFYIVNLVVLKLSKSNITESWVGWEQFKTAGCCLKVLELEDLNLTRIPDLSSFSNLQRLVIRQEKRLLHIDPSIGDLKSLNSLELENNIRHRGILNLPSSICSLKALTRLLIKEFKVERFPENIGELKGLKILEISSSWILESLPDSIGNLEWLCELRLPANGITELPESIGKLKNLIKLDVSSNKLKGLPTTMGNLVRLEVLYLDNNFNLKGEFLDEFHKLLSLKILDLSWTGICTIPERLLELPCLESLSLKNCRDFDGMLHLPKSLTTLEIPYGCVVDLSSLTNLVKLSLSNPHQGGGVDPQVQRGTGVSGIQHLNKLKYLNIELPPPLMSRELYSGLDKLSRLRSLSLSCENPSVLRLPTGLESLTLYFCTSLNQWEWISNCQVLQELTLKESDATEIRLNGLESLSNLISLSIFGCKSLVRIQDISRLGKLRQLYFLMCPKLVEVGGLAQLLGSLQLLQIVGCNSIPYLPKPSDTKSPTRLHLFISHCSKLWNAKDFYKGPYEDYFQKQDIYAPTSEPCPGSSGSETFDSTQEEPAIASEKHSPAMKNHPPLDQDPPTLPNLPMQQDALVLQDPHVQQPWPMQDDQPPPPAVLVDLETEVAPPVVFELVTALQSTDEPMVEQPRPDKGENKRTSSVEQLKNTKKARET